METIDTSKTIGSSEAGDLLSVEEFGRGCVRALGYKKLEVPVDFPDRQRDLGSLVRGNRMEPIAADIYEEVTARKTARTKTHIHKKFPWARTSVDRTIRARGDNGHEGTGDLELKSRNEGMWWRIKRLGSLPGTTLQAQWHMWVTGHKWASVAELGVFGSLPLLWYDVNPDPEIQEIFRVEGGKFAETVFERRQLPPPPFEATDPRCKACSWRLTCRGEEADSHEWNLQKEMEKTGKHLVQIDDSSLVQTMADIDSMKAEIDSLEESVSTAKEQVLDRLVGYDGAILSGFGKLYRLPVISTSLDTKSLKQDNPDIYARYLRKIDTGKYSLRAYRNKEKGEKNAI